QLRVLESWRKDLPHEIRMPARESLEQACVAAGGNLVAERDVGHPSCERGVGDARQRLVQVRLLERIGGLLRTRQERIEGLRIGLCGNDVERRALCGRRACMRTQLLMCNRDHRVITHPTLDLQELIAEYLQVG